MRKTNGKLTLRIGTRRSDLALWQAEWVQRALQQANPGLTTELVKMDTRGDKTLDVLIPELGGKGFFTEELDRALLHGEIDLAVHSLKDLPTELPEGLALGAVCNRRYVSDVLLSGGHRWTLESLPYAATVGTCSLRRTAQLKRIRPDLNITPLRGNVPTRIRKLKAGQYDAIVLAEAGVRRLGLDQEITEVIALELLLPAPAQGALAIEVNTKNTPACRIVAQLDEPEVRAATTCERAFLNCLGAGCQVPVAALATCEDGRLHFRGLIAALEGDRVAQGEIQGEVEEAAALGKLLAEQLLRDGGQEILENVKRDAVAV